MKFLPILLIILFLFPLASQAFFGLGSDPCAGLSEYAHKLCSLVFKIATILYVISGGLALIVILVGGITIMTSAGNEDNLKKGKKIITNGLIGAAIIFCAGFILELLNEFLAPLL